MPTPTLSPKAQQYLTQPEVKKALEKLRNKPGGYPVSDLICKDPEADRNLYFVDLVQQGGGVLGVALVGYTYALEEAGIRFASLAGTSAGAINTLMLAASGTPEMPKSRAVLNAMCEKPFSEFVDPGWRVLWPIRGLFHKYWIVKAPAFIALIVLNLWGIFVKKGLCSGKAFEQWLKDLMHEHEVSTLPSLLQKMNLFPDSMKAKEFKGDFKKINPEKVRAHLAIVAADISTQTKAVFPQMAYLYAPPKNGTVADNTDLAIAPEEMVRASMAIPVFFQPKYFSPPKKGEKNVPEWIDAAGYTGKVPDKVAMVDGGVMSNFPIDIFHQLDSTPQRPTFGIRLGMSRTEASKTKGLVSLLGSTFNGARRLRDFEFLFKNDDYKHLVKYIDTDPHSWLNFNISEDHKMELFKMGVKAAEEFLEGTEEKKGFDWQSYKALRRRNLFFSSTDRMESLWDKDDAIRKLGLVDKQAIDKNYENRSNVFDPEIERCSDFYNNLEVVIKAIKKGKRIVVLWIDNDPANDCFELSVLRAFGLEFVCALNDDEALEKLKSDPDIRIIVTDSHRQGYYLQGLEFCERLFSEGVYKLPILLHSISLATKYEQNSEAEKAIIEDMKKKYSPHIIGNYIVAKDLIFAVIAEIATICGGKN